MVSQVQLALAVGLSDFCAAGTEGVLALLPVRQTLCYPRIGEWR